MRDLILMLAGSLTLGLIVTLFGSYDYLLAKAWTDDGFYLGIEFNGKCGAYKDPIFIKSTEYAKLEQIGISCKSFNPIYRMTILGHQV